MKRVCCLLLACAFAFAQQPAPPAKPAAPAKPVPPLGVEVPAADRAELEAGLKRLRAGIEKIKANPLAPDVQIYHEAVRYALENNEFFQVGDIAKAKVLLQKGEERAGQLAEGKSPWTTATGLVVRGYVSKIDKSIQPYGLVVPASYAPTVPHRWRLDAWFMGRTETNSEVNFLTARERSRGEFTPPDTIVLHPYGRLCNANKMAGEVDFFEALDAVKRNYAIDENRIIVRGFSMGGASVWQFGTHFGLWAAIQPGAGFSESAEFLRLNLTGPNAPPAWEQTLYHMYDSKDYAINLSNTTTVAYNGEIDGQKQAADVMEKSMAEEGMSLLRIIGPKTGARVPSRFEGRDQSRDRRDCRARPATRTRARSASPRGRSATTDEVGDHRFARQALGARAAQCRDHGREQRGGRDRQRDLRSRSTWAPGGYPIDLAGKPVVTIDGQKVTAPAPMSDRSWKAWFRKSGGRWSAVDAQVVAGLHKVHGLQGPVDDAFMDSFVMVTPTGTPVAPGVAPWVATEQAHAIKEWRRHFRGEAQVRTDKEITDADIASSNLVLWGDPGSNAVLAKIADKLPVRWTAEGVVIGTEKFAADKHAPVLIYPNPLNPKKYVVLNSGFTFREFDYLNNARQIPQGAGLCGGRYVDPRPTIATPGKIVTARILQRRLGAREVVWIEAAAIHPVVCAGGGDFPPQLRDVASMGHGLDLLVVVRRCSGRHAAAVRVACGPSRAVTEPCVPDGRLGATRSASRI